MTAWAPGVLSLVGVLLGVGLAHLLTRRASRTDDRRRRLDEALRCVALAIADTKFTFRADVAARPNSVRAADLDDLERRLWLAGVERYFNRLRETRESLAALAADDFAIGNYWRDDDETQAHLEEIFTYLQQRRLGRV